MRGALLRRETDVHVNGYQHDVAQRGDALELLQYLPYTDRYDYLAAMNNNLAYSLAVEALLGVSMPRRAEMIRIICAELNRIGSHLIAIGQPERSGHT